MAKPLLIEIASDVICPWCYIGKRRLEKALASLKDEVEVRIEWLPFQLNPDLPAQGVARAEYRRAKFGSVEQARALDARVAQEGAGEGIAFAFDRMERTPNTVAAHQLIDLAQTQDRASPLASGKAGAVAQALEGPDQPVQCPAQLARDGIWIMDRAAASGLRHQPPR